MCRRLTVCVTSQSPPRGINRRLTVYGTFRYNDCRMKNPRRYGSAPFSTAVIHGGPGAPGYMAPVARELSSNWGVLEPLQTAVSLEGQVQELRIILKKNADLPVTLIGSSWGAMLSFILTARYPELVKKLILIGSAVFDDRYAAGIQQTRLGRLSAPQRKEVESLTYSLNDPSVKDKTKLLARLGDILLRADHYNPLTLDIELLEDQYDVYQKVWKDAERLRSSGMLLELGKNIECPVIAIHGDYDPHPVEGVERPLTPILKNFRLFLLKNCGHLPWIELEALDEFYRILKDELR